MLQAVHHGRHHRANRPWLLLPGHRPKAAAAAHPPAVRSTPDAVDHRDRRGKSAAVSGEVRRVPGTPPERVVAQQRADRTGAGSDVRVLGQEERANL